MREEEWKIRRSFRLAVHEQTNKRTKERRRSSQCRASPISHPSAMPRRPTAAVADSNGIHLCQTNLAFRFGWAHSHTPATDRPRERTRSQRYPTRPGIRRRFCRRGKYEAVCLPPAASLMDGPVSRNLQLFLCDKIVPGFLACILHFNPPWPASQISIPMAYSCHIKSVGGSDQSSKGFRESRGATHGNDLSGVA